MCGRSLPLRPDRGCVSANGSLHAVFTLSPPAAGFDLRRLLTTTG